jgi:uncharacterized protein YaeQ
MREHAEAARRKLRGSVVRYENPVAPALDESEWEMNRLQCSFAMTSNYGLLLRNDFGNQSRSPHQGRAVALDATMYVFQIQLADADRSVFENLELRVARHPSETEEYLLTRVLAYALEYTEGIAFSKGLSSSDEPAIVVRDLTGVLRTWIDIGAPDAARLHKASKAAPRVVVYTHKDIATVMAQFAGQRIHRADAIEIYAMDRELLKALAARLQRRMSIDLSVSERHLYLSMGETTLTGIIEAHRIGG